MNEDLLIKAIEDDFSKLEEVLRASYSLIPLSEERVCGIAEETNKSLGYELFNDLNYPALVRDFSLVTRVAARYAIESTK